MNNKPDIVALKWVLSLMIKQAEKAEVALVEYGNDQSQKQALLRCMWAVHQITSTLKTLGMAKAEMLTMEMERALNYLYKDKVDPERSKLAMGGLMQALKVIPAYLELTESIRIDTGCGLGQYVNDLRRFVGERPRPKAFFFHMDIPENAGITVGAQTASDEEIMSRANVMLALYLEMAKQGLRKRNTAESMKNVARIARKMQMLLAGTDAERFWFTMIGLCEGTAGDLIQPDECIAQIFKAGAFSIKFARENGGLIEAKTDYDSYTQQMLFYIASCKSSPVHISNVKEAFEIDENTISDANRPLVHSDALIIALNGALDHINKVVAYIEAHDLSDVAALKPEDQDTTALESIEAAEHRLIAAGQIQHADTLMAVQRQLKQFFGGVIAPAAAKMAETVSSITNGLMTVKLDVEHKLNYGLHSSYSGKDFELRETVANATFKQMGIVENHLHQILRRKALKNALDKKPEDEMSVLRLTTALQRHLNKSDQGHDELRQAIRDANDGNADVDVLYRLAREYQNEIETMPDSEGIDKSLELLQNIADALIFSNMQREGLVIEQCHDWLAAASDAGSVHEDEPFRCFADAFAQIEMHLQRSLVDPQEDTSHMVEFAEQRATELHKYMQNLSPGRATAAVPQTCAELEEQEKVLVQDAEMPPEFRDIFIEESEEIATELVELTAAWLLEPEDNAVLRNIRRHFHTFKGNGRAVGANILGELGWAAQDMLDRTLDIEMAASERLKELVNDVVAALPALVESYKDSTESDIDSIRQLTAACFAMASGGGQEEQAQPIVSGNIGAAARLAEVPPVRKISTH
ncbi:MAG: HPt (histidine-containing phosphotransfer) domain-containing protein [Halioglobus sp.]